MKTVIPETLEAAITAIIGDMDDEARAHVLNKTSSPAGSHFFGGMAMRNQWGLWGDSVLARHFKTRFGLGHADDMSGMIMTGVWATVRGEPFDPDQEAKRYQTYWRTKGLDPMTGGPFGSESNTPPPPDPALRPLKPGIPPRNRYQPPFWTRLGNLIFGQR